MVRNKRPALKQDLTPSPPPHPPIRNIIMEETIQQLLAQNAQMNAKLDMICGKLPKVDKIDDIENQLRLLVTENTSLRQELVKRDEKIDQLTSQINKLDQASRATSLRILGLPISHSTPSTAVPDIVLREIIKPCLDAATACGDLPPSTTLPFHLLVTNVFAIPTKNNMCSVILKFSSEFVRNLIFKHKKEALPKDTDISSNRVRNRYSIFEDLTATNHAMLRSLADDPRVRSVWSYGGQLRFKTHDSETVHKVKNLSDTFDSIVTPSRSAHTTHPP
jgi:hypothetical protein